MVNHEKMKVEVWSDVMCPFCYIGKRHYEKALEQFSEPATIELEWKSFQLDPTIPNDLNGQQNTYQYLSASKGMDLEQVKQMTAGVTEMANKAGLHLDFDKALAANTYNAHRIIQMAKNQGVGDAAEENFFNAHFVEGLDVNNAEVLKEIGMRSGLTEEQVTEALTGDDCAYRVNQDILEARNIGVRGVPFFVFNRRYAVSGAQPVEDFVKTLEESFSEWRGEHPMFHTEGSEGPACTPDGNCN